MTKNKFKYNEKVRLKTISDIYFRVRGKYWPKINMYKYFNEIVTIVDYAEDEKNGNYYKIREDDMVNNWNENWFKKIKNE